MIEEKKTKKLTERKWELCYEDESWGEKRIMQEVAEREPYPCK